MCVCLAALTVIPAVDFYAATALEQNTSVGLSGRLSIQLVPLQVGVVGGVDEVVGEWLCHVLIHCLVFWINGRVVLATKKAI